LARESRGYERGDLSWLDVTAREVIEAERATERPADAVGAHFFNDLQTLNRLAGLNELGPICARMRRSGCLQLASISSGW
jgi:hypothetical protein